MCWYAPVSLSVFRKSQLDKTIYAESRIVVVPSIPPRSHLFANSCRSSMVPFVGMSGLPTVGTGGHPSDFSGEDSWPPGRM